MISRDLIIFHDIVSLLFFTDIMMYLVSYVSWCFLEGFTRCQCPLSIPPATNRLTKPTAACSATRAEASKDMRCLIRVCFKTWLGPLLWNGYHWIMFDITPAYRAATGMTKGMKEAESASTCFWNMLKCVPQNFEREFNIPWHKQQNCCRLNSWLATGDASRQIELCIEKDRVHCHLETAFCVGKQPAEDANITYLGSRIWIP